MQGTLENHPEILPIMMTKRIFAALPLCIATLCHTAPLAPPVRAEINALLARLQSSGCEFNRNGSWYSGADAKTHLLRKLDYLEGKGLINSAEQFIERGAAGSSSSGKPYLVRCAGSVAVESRQWLSAELRVGRASRAAAASAPR